jgi:hypothetical protein
LVEQRIENPRVGGSIPPLATIQISKLYGDIARQVGRCFHLVSTFSFIRLLAWDQWALCSKVSMFYGA